VSVFVVDASLIVKWFVPELYSDAARSWLDAAHDYIAPDLVFPEAGNAIWKKVRRGELTREDGRQLVADMSRVGVEAVSMRGLLTDAHAVAVATDITIYDATYLTLAVRLETEVITCDERFARKLAEHPLLGLHVRSVVDFVAE
jgi:predicted nucleic acid-binding protein